jgi:allantoate deiminase
MTSTDTKPRQAETTSLGRTVHQRLDALARFSSETGALTRLYLTPQHKAAALQVESWMREAGMQTHIDAVGTVVGRYEGSAPDAPTLLLGSHIDTVRDAGKYDGSLGVIAAIEAVAELNRSHTRLPFAVEVLAFGDEEGVRFPVTLTGSRAIAGILDPSAFDVEDADGVSVREALQEFGLNPFDIPKVPRRRDQTLGYVELHIEQGPVLENENLPLGIVTAIAGASRFTLRVSGVAGHAGTVPMELRRDALAAAAEMVLAVERLAAETADLVATVGQIEAAPGAVNVIASGAVFTLDIRSPEDRIRKDAIATLWKEFQAIAARRGVSVAKECFYDEAAVACDPTLVKALAQATEAVGVPPRLLPSGAGHDGLAVSALCPIGMLFLRCRGGISHNPAESITVADASVAVAVITHFLRHYEPA